MYPVFSIREDQSDGRRRARSVSQVGSVQKSLSKIIVFPATATTTKFSSFRYPLQKHNEPSSPQSWTYHINTIWLFTFSDLKTIVVPKTLFGLSHALCLSVFFPLSSNGSPPPTDPLPIHALATTAPRVLFWVWLNLLPFAINNQRQPAAILEDGINKPWRPMPSGRINFRAASTIMFGTYLAAFLLSCQLGGLRQHLALIFLGFCYNDLGGADVSCVTRNLINGLGFVCFGTGALEVALAAPAMPLLWTPSMVRWQLLLATLVATSVHTQDMYDQEGDALRGRWTVPLSLGDGLARWSIAAAVPFWTMLATMFWRVPLATGLIPSLLALTVAARTLTCRSVAEDKVTFRVWNVWVVAIYTLPLVKSFT